MKSRLDLQLALEKIKGVRKVYFQPPASVRLVYPCVIYELSNKWSKRADDMRYIKGNRYQLKLIEKEADSPISELILDSFDYCSFDRAYTSNNLYHNVFTLYF